ncbi:MAG: hypothetical protein ACERKD_03730 [Prolixibacteraceae bacterium]
MRKEIFIQQKTIYRLTWLSRLILLGFFLLLSFITLKYLPYYLSKNVPVHGEILVLDGQMPDYAIEAAIERMKTESYRLVLTTGSNLPEGYYISGIKTMADLSRATFLALGFDSTKVIAIPTKFVARNRTFNSANTLNEWLKTNHPEIQSIDVLTVGCHARRSWYLFHKALGEQMNVGIISLDHPGYDNKTWWKSSIGARTVISETIAYFYIRLTT